MTIVDRIYRKSRFIFSYLRSSIVSNFRQHRYTDIESFIMFVGYPRSGHSLIAALLDAHPEIVISMEWGALSHLQMGYRRSQIFYSIEHHSKLFTKRLKNIWTGYSYRVDGMWQGEYETIKLIGDKLAGQTTMILKIHPELLDKLRQKTGYPIKIIHVIRNPYDTITTIAKRAFEKSNLSGDLQADFLSPFIDKYFDRTDVVQKLKDTGRYEICDLFHEELINDSNSVLTKLLGFMEVRIPDDYILKCSEIIYKEPHKSRLDFDWPDDLKEKVKNNIGKYRFLQNYSFES